MTSHKTGANENFELVYRRTWEMDLMETSGTDWDQNEKLDVTLERPDVTLYGLNLPVCHFVCLFVGLAVFIGVRVCVTGCLLLRCLFLFCFF